MSMQVGVLLPSRDVVALGRGPDAILDLAVEAERCGYDSVWLGESVVARPRYDVIATLGALAVRTERVVLGTAVVVAPLRHPAAGGRGVRPRRGLQNSSWRNLIGQIS